MKLRATVSLMLVSIVGFVAPVRADDSIRDVDFNNFTYQLRPGGIGPSGEITLNQGEYESGHASVWVKHIYYSDLNGNGTEDALVVLRASGGGSGASTHAFGFTETNGSLKEILYRLNFIRIQPQRNGFVLVRGNPLNTGSQVCPPDSMMQVNAVDVETYQWNGSNSVPVDHTTVRGQQACNFRDDR